MTIFGKAAFVVSLAFLVGILLTANDDAMQTCLDKHSVDTCHYALNR